MDMGQISGYLLSIPACGALWMQWQQNRSLQKKVAHTEQLFQKRTQELERVQKEWETSLGLEKGRQQKWAQVEKQLKEAKARTQETVDQQAGLKATQEKALRSLSEKVEDKESQISTLVQQLKEQDQLVQLAQKKAKEAERAAAIQVAQAEEQTKASAKGQFHEINTLRAENRKLESQLQQMKKTVAASTIDAEQEKRLKKQLAQYRYFNQTVSSQREMLEERLQNWETALKGLATAVCAEKQVTAPTALGPLVGTALELLHQSQLVDDEAFAPHGTQVYESIVAT